MAPDRLTPDLLTTALDARAELIDRLENHEATDCYRLFHGVVEGRRGMSVDRYGPCLLVQTWRDAASPEELAAIREVLLGDLDLAVWHRGKPPHSEHLRQPDTSHAYVGRELGLRFDVTPPTLHRGQDPYLFLDFRAARRWVRAHSEGKRLLNLFSYTCGIGVAGAAGGAKQVWNVDFAESALAVGKRNAGLNDMQMGNHHENALPVMRHLAGLPLGARRNRRPSFNRLDAAPFDLVVLDPPRWAKTPWGAIDVTRDYQSLFKPALLCLAEGGALLATNHVPRVELGDWVESLRRCADKADRPLVDIELLTPEADFPSFDGKPPLKMAVCRVA